MSVSKALRTQPFFFTMELTGPGLELEEPVKASAKKGVSLVIEKEVKQKKLPDPISESIQERKDYGSYLSVIKGAKTAEIETIKFQCKGIPDKDLNFANEKFMDPPTVLSKSFVSNPARRSLKDRKKSNKEQQ